MHFSPQGGAVPWTPLNHICGIDQLSPWTRINPAQSKIPEPPVLKMLVPQDKMLDLLIPSYPRQLCSNVDNSFVRLQKTHKHVAKHGLRSNLTQTILN